MADDGMRHDRAATLPGRASRTPPTRDRVGEDRAGQRRAGRLDFPNQAQDRVWRGGSDRGRRPGGLPVEEDVHGRRGCREPGTPGVLRTCGGPAANSGLASAGRR